MLDSIILYRTKDNIDINTFKKSFNETEALRMEGEM